MLVGILQIIVLILAAFWQSEGRAADPQACILITPFANFVPTADEAAKSSAKQAAVVMTRLVGESMLNSRRFRYIDGSFVAAALAEQNIVLPNKTDLPQALWIGRLFDATAVLIGSVNDYSYQYENNLPIGAPLVAIEGTLISVASGDVLWQGRVSLGGGDWLQSKRRPLSEVAMLAVEQLVKQMPGEALPASLESPICGPDKISSDLDNDGILNLADKCPTRPETKNAIDDFDGCPEMETADTSYQQFLTLDADRLVLKEAVQFSANGAELTDSSKAALKQLADFLLKNPQIKRVMIEGFSTANTKEQFRERFAFSRATAVKVYLMQQGVEERRLIAVGYGSIEQQLNQEIEFTIVE